MVNLLGTHTPSYIIFMFSLPEGVGISCESAKWANIFKNNTPSVEAYWIFHKVCVFQN